MYRSRSSSGRPRPVSSTGKRKRRFCRAAVASAFFASAISSSSTGAMRGSLLRACSRQKEQRKTFRDGASAPTSQMYSCTTTGLPQVGQREVKLCSTCFLSSRSPCGIVATADSPASKWRRSGGRSTTSASRRVSAVEFERVDPAQRSNRVARNPAPAPVNVDDDVAGCRARSQLGRDDVVRWGRREPLEGGELRPRVWSDERRERVRHVSWSLPTRALAATH